MAQPLRKVDRAINGVHYPKLRRLHMHSALGGELFTQPCFTRKMLFQPLANELVNGHIHIGHQLIVFFQPLRKTLLLTRLDDHLPGFFGDGNGSLKTCR